MGIHVRAKHGRLYLDIYDQGSRRWEPLGLTVPADAGLRREVYRQAEAIRVRREMQLSAGREGLVDPVAGREGLAHYAKAVAAKLPKTSHLRKSLKYLEPFAGSLRLAAVDEAFLERYRDHLLNESGLARQTAVNYFQAAKTLLRRAERDRLVGRNPAANVKGISPPDSRRQALTQEEVARLAAADPAGRCGSEVRRAFLFSCLTGLRVSDLRALTWGDVERLPAPRLALAQQKTGGMVYVPLNPSAWRLIDDGTIHLGVDLVFSLPEGSASAIFRRWAKLASITKPLSYHVARHSYAVSLLESGAGIYEVSKLLGHRSIREVETYARATDRLKREAVERLPEIELKSKKKA